MFLYFAASLYLSSAIVSIAASPLTGNESPQPTSAVSASASSSATVITAILPQNEPSASAVARKAQILSTRKGFDYGPSLLGCSFFPNGTIANQTVMRDIATLAPDALSILEASIADLTAVTAAFEKYGGIKNISDYNLIYRDKTGVNQWPRSLPDGVETGMLTNYTDDRLFAMERLSVNPYILQRAKTDGSDVPFTVEDTDSVALTARNFKVMLSSGNIFFADHSYQKGYPLVESPPQRYTAYCSALFYIDSTSGDLMPLAIRTDPQNGWYYSPLDGKQGNQAWLLAKIMFNANDIFHSQMVHVANSHAVAEIVWEAAIRTLSPAHPIYQIFDHLMIEGFAFRYKALFAPPPTLFGSGPNDLINSVFSMNNVAGGILNHDFYENRGAGKWQGNYLETNLERRGLLNPPNGQPVFKNFPYYDDAKPIRDEIRIFVSAFVASYYCKDSDVIDDYELQAFIAECNGRAQVKDFPSSITSTSTLIDVVTHMGFLTGIKHHVLNTGSPIHAGAVLPFHPLAIFAPIPTQKGTITNIMPFLPPLSQSLKQLSLVANFNRPGLAAQKRTVAYMFNDNEAQPQFQAGLNPATVDAASTFSKAMLARSQVVQSRAFDSQGLSQGMPFIYTALDPGTLPFFFSV